MRGEKGSDFMFATRSPAFPVGGRQALWFVAFCFSSPPSDDSFPSKTPAEQPGTINYPRKELEPSRKYQDFSPLFTASR